MPAWARVSVLVAIAAVFFAGSVATAQDEGKGRGGRPPGWAKGKKRGWKGDVPPGIQKKGGRPPGWAKGK